MKRLGRIVSVGSLLSCLAVAPVAAGVTWEAGFKGGLGLGKLSGDTGINDVITDGGVTVIFSGDIGDPRTGFSGGGFANARISDAFGIRLEVLYAQKGGKGPVDVTVDGTPAGTADITFKVNYVEIPLLAVGSFPVGARAMVDVFGGPTVAFKAGAKLRAEVQGQGDETDIGSDIKGTDFGIAAGAGIRLFASQRMSIVLEGRHTLGLVNILDAAGGPSLKNRALAFTAGIAFPLGGRGAGP